MTRALPAAALLGLLALMPAPGRAEAVPLPKACMAYGAEITSDSLDRVYAKCGVGDTIMLSDDKYLGLTISTICNFDKQIVQIPGFVICVLDQRRRTLSPLP
ncbi:hypothetical protein [Zavarzinia sp. CC-PAN008]|uniref:hypothetical protein n=1 Tax=Zavarzinia sp. CC-PAN008 TaxID=3243332 RepID=UPI003F745E34